MSNILHLILMTALLTSCGSKDKKEKALDDSPPIETDGPDQAGSDLVFPNNLGTTSAKGTFIAHLKWMSEIKAEGFVSAQVMFAKPDRTAPGSVKDFAFDPQMPSMGHGTSVQDQVFTPDAERNYIIQVEGIYFIMGGPWEVNVSATVDGVSDKVIFPVRVP